MGRSVNVVQRVGDGAHVTLATSVTEELLRLWSAALVGVRKSRGGQALIDTLGTGDGDELLGGLVDQRALWLHVDGTVRGFLIVRAGVIAAVYVDPPARRLGIATSLVRTVLQSSLPPTDGYALPGDRATKSLYESLGWKARLLTMRAD